MKNSLKAAVLVATLAVMTVLPAVAADQIVIPGEDGTQPQNIQLDLFRNARGELFQVIYVDKNANGKYDAGVDTVLEMEQVGWSN